MNARDIRSMDIVYVANCILNQAERAMGIVKTHHAMITEFVLYCCKNKINIYQMPCPELDFDDERLGGYKRRPIRKESYDIPEYKEHCQKIVDDVVDDIEHKIYEGDYRVLAVVGVDRSPSCGVNEHKFPDYTFKSGVLVDLIKQELELRGMDVPIIGLDCFRVNKCIEQLERIRKCSAQKT